MTIFPLTPFEISLLVSGIALIVYALMSLGRYGEKP